MIGNFLKPWVLPSPFVFPEPADGTVGKKGDAFLFAIVHDPLLEDLPVVEITFVLNAGNLDDALGLLN